MSKVDTLIKKLCQKPTPADFRYSDLRKIMAYFGYVESNKGATKAQLQAHGFDFTIRRTRLP